MAKHLELANHFANFSQKSRFIFGSVEAFFLPWNAFFTTLGSFYFIWKTAVNWSFSDFFRLGLKECNKIPFPTKT